METVDQVCVGVSVSVVVLYLAYYVYEVVVWPDKTNFGFNLASRSLWVRQQCYRHGGEILAVQSLRNSTTSASFFATASSTIAFLIITETHNDDSYDSEQRVQFTVLALVLFIGFMCFIVVLKSYDHVGFLISACRHTQGGGEIDPMGERGLRPELAFLAPAFWEDKAEVYRQAYVKSAVSTMHSALIGYTLGIKCYYLAIIVLAWIVSPIALLCASVAMVAFMYWSDHSYGRRPSHKIAEVWRENSRVGTPMMEMEDLVVREQKVELELGGQPRVAGTVAELQSVVVVEEEEVEEEEEEEEEAGHDKVHDVADDESKRKSLSHTNSQARSPTPT